MGIFILLILAALSLCAPDGCAGGPERVEGAAVTDLLLDRFRPALYFVADIGPGGARVDYPCSYIQDDAQIENNFAVLATQEPDLCYGAVHEQRDVNGKICWVVEYDYYYPRNWSEIPPPQGCYTHEHDWEWIYIVVGFADGDYRPYCACFSGHTAGNPDLFGVSGKVRLFPSVAGGSVWRTEWERHPEWAPRVTLGWDEHVEATALSSGNAFDGSPTQPRSPTYWTHYSVISRQTLSSSCSGSDRFCFGDPSLAFLCIGRSGQGECDDPREPPWIRQGLGEQDPLPYDFALPIDWEENPSTEIHPDAAAGRSLGIAPNPSRGRIRLTLPAGPRPTRLDLLDVSGRVVRRLAREDLPGVGPRDSYDLDDLSSGVYLLRARWTEENEEVRRVVLLP